MIVEMQGRDEPSARNYKSQSQDILDEIKTVGKDGLHKTNKKL